MPRRAFMLIADIAGYTRFMKVHRVNLSHAQYIVAQLLEAVIDAASPKLRLAKLEGDAGFFFAEVPPDESLASHLDRVRLIADAFRRRKTELEIDRLCNCDGCVQASQLRIKFIAHEGEVAFQKIKRHSELAGVDVILVHRLLKNDVPLPEYLLMSEPVTSRASEAVRHKCTPIEHDLEGFGPTPGFYVDLEALAPAADAPYAPSFWRKLVGWVAMTWRSLPYFLGLRTPCEGFTNLGAIGEGKSLPPYAGVVSSAPPPAARKRED
ncbi:MAG: DUF2652 domain-containing protein [Polyangiaceae bacterium]|nr:DUF2652 domain-containing protein [Polyangiaceae bacterium]